MLAEVWLEFAAGQTTQGSGYAFHRITVGNPLQKKDLFASGFLSVLSGSS